MITHSNFRMTKTSFFENILFAMIMTTAPCEGHGGRNGCNKTVLPNKKQFCHGFADCLLASDKC